MYKQFPFCLKTKQKMKILHKNEKHLYLCRKLGVQYEKHPAGNEKKYLRKNARRKKLNKCINNKCLLNKNEVPPPPHATKNSRNDKSMDHI